MLFQSAHIRYCKTNKYRLSACTYFDDSYDTYIYLIVKSHSHEHLRSSCKEKKKKKERERKKERRIRTRRRTPSTGILPRFVERMNLRETE